MENKIYWFTGQPGHGKTTLARMLTDFFYKSGINVFHIDGDDLRKITNNKDYTKEGRVKNIELAQNISKFLYIKNNSVIVSMVSPYIKLREKFKKDVMINVVEIYVYKRGGGEKDIYHVKNYEPPINDFITIDITNNTPKKSFSNLFKKLFF